MRRVRQTWREREKVANWNARLCSAPCCVRRMRSRSTFIDLCTIRLRAIINVTVLFRNAILLLYFINSLVLETIRAAAFIRFPVAVLSFYDKLTKSVLRFSSIVLFPSPFPTIVTFNYSHSDANVSATIKPNIFYALHNILDRWKWKKYVVLSSKKIGQDRERIIFIFW